MSLTSVGQVQIEKDDVGTTRSGRRHPLLAVVGQHDLVSAALKPARKKIPNLLVVLDQQNFGHPHPFELQDRRRTPTFAS